MRGTHVVSWSTDALDHLDLAGVVDVVHRDAADEHIEGDLPARRHLFSRVASEVRHRGAKLLVLAGQQLDVALPVGVGGGVGNVNQSLPLSGNSPRG